jgi:hypothetical protein
MGESTVGSFSHQLRTVRESWPGRGWTWDERNGCVASSFSVANQDEYHTILRGVFPNRWDHLTIRQAPRELTQIATRTGGIRHGQWLFAPVNAAGAFAYALWWPWGDDTTVSVRLALSPDGQASRATVRAVFGVDPQG